MNNIPNGILHFFEKLSWLDWLNYILTYSLQATLIVVLLWPLRKLLAKVTNVQLAVRVLATIRLQSESGLDLPAALTLPRALRYNEENAEPFR